MFIDFFLALEAVGVPNEALDIYHKAKDQICSVRMIFFWYIKEIVFFALRQQ